VAQAAGDRGETLALRGQQAIEVGVGGRDPRGDDPGVAETLEILL
jgi:hypothetical protein